MDLHRWIILLYIIIEAAEAWKCFKKREYDGLWERYKKTYNKCYSGRDIRRRRCIFNKAVDRIIKHNSECDMGKHKFRRGLNKYSDLTHKEFVSRLNGFLGTPESRRKRHRTRRPLLGAESYPDSLDWRDSNLVTGVKDQGSCGSCWAFSAVASLEGQILKMSQGRNGIDLSEQNLIDCSSSNGNNGCQGGLMTQAFEYIIRNGGIASERDYPYEARTSQCRFNGAAARCRNYEEVLSGREDALKEALVNVGPISVGIDASLQSFQDYKSGIYEDTSCNSEYLDHAVLLIGYGTEDGTDYWIIKNSYGTSWGENGYARMARNSSNLCGIATQASYPVV